jgi:hypothetical protein
MGQSILQRSFAAGEVSPGFGARADLARYVQALRACRNFVVQRHGGAYNRSGSRFIARAKDGGNVFLFKFLFPAADQSYVIEAGEEYFRFYRNGAQVTVSGVAAYDNGESYVPGELVSSGSVNYYCIAATVGNAPPDTDFWYALEDDIYEVPTPYGAGVFAPPAPLCWAQSGSIVTLTHLDHAPLELVYGGAATSWVLRAIATGPTIGTPDHPAGMAGPAGTRELNYQITAVDAITGEESLPSDTVTIASADEGTPDDPHELSWDPVSGAAEYNVYADPFENAVFGYLGSAGDVAFFDVGQVPDFLLTPPRARVLFASSNNYPAVSVVHAQRRFFCGTHNDRELGYASQVGRFSNFGTRLPLQDDDALTFNLASNVIQPILHLVSLKLGLVMLTDAGGWVLHGGETGVLAPSTLNLEQHSYIGSSFTRPAVVGQSILYVTARGNALRDLAFDRALEGLGGRDLTVLAGHLFRRKTIVQVDYQHAPDSVVWAVRSDGTLLGLTYMEDEDVWGWHRHDTINGLYKQVAVIPEGDEEAVYVVVEREVDDTTRKYIERFELRHPADVEDAFHVDSGITQETSDPETTVAGLDHLEGETVVAFGDAAKIGTTYVVNSSGAITLTTAASKVHVGLPVTCDLETLDLDVGGSSVRDKKKRINSVALLLEDSYTGFYLGPNSAKLRLFRPPTAPATTDPRSGRMELPITAEYSDTGRVFLRHSDPTPITVLSIIPNVEVGG